MNYENLDQWEIDQFLLDAISMAEKTKQAQIIVNSLCGAKIVTINEFINNRLVYESLARILPDC